MCSKRQRDDSSNNAIYVEKALLIVLYVLNHLYLITIYEGDTIFDLFFFYIETETGSGEIKDQMMYYSQVLNLGCVAPGTTFLTCALYYIV